MLNKKKENIEKLQQLLWEFAAKSYHGSYLWKYLEYELTSGIIADYQQQDKNIAIQGGLSDMIPDSPQSEIDRTEELLDGLKEKDILFGLIPLRRLYKGKLEHTALDAYIRVMDEDKYAVIEPDLGGQEDEIVYTKNRNRFSLLGVFGKYGLDSVDKMDLTEFLVREYVNPLEQAFQVKIPKQFVLRSIYKSSLVLQERKAYLKFFEDVLNKVSPKVVCFTHGPDPIICFLHEAAQKKRIPTVEIEHGAIIRNFIYPDTLAYSNYYLTHSDLLTKPMLESGLKNVYAVGKPGVYSDTNQNLKDEMPIVVSFISSMERGFFDKAMNLAKKLDKQNFLIVYKAHSSEDWQKEEMDRIMEETGNLQFLEGVVDVRDVFAISDIVVGIRSSGILDALPYHKIKVITLEDEKEKELLVGNFSFFDTLQKLGDIAIANSEEQLYQEVIGYKRGEQYRGKENHYWPADAEKRFVEFMDRFLNEEKNGKAEL